jgi:hypothetical protein
MRTRFIGGVAAVAMVLALLVQVASAQPAYVPVADYQDDFSTTGFPAGWRYLWNANGPLGNPANYVPLVLDNGRYETQANSAYPDPAPGNSLAAGTGPIDPLLFPPDPVFGPYPNTFVRPGAGIAAGGGFERAIILAYTFSAQDIAAGGGGDAYLTAYDFAVAASPAGTSDGVSARVYHDDDPTPFINFSLDSVPPFPFPPGFRFETRLDPDPIPLGTYAAGETLYVAIGANTTDIGDEMRLDYTISLIPEPASLSLFLPGGLLLLRRRRVSLR